MKPIELDMSEGLDVCIVNGTEYLFTNLRIRRDSLPEGVVAYDVRGDCDGVFCQIQNYVWVNHWGTLIGKKPLPLQDGEYLPEGEDGCFTGGHYSLSEFLEREQR